VGSEESLMFGDRGRGGRPRKGEGPRVPYEDLDRILVFGEVVPCEDGNGTTVYYPSYRELAERYGVSNSVIAEYAKSHNVQRRRKEAQARIQVKAEQKLVEMRAKAIAVSKDDELRIIDTYLIGFETALAENRVRFDNAADFNTMVRLKEFVLGNADSRQEIHAALSLETLQARHRQMMHTLDASSEERGEVENALPEKGDTEKTLPEPPAPAIEVAAEEPPARFAGRFRDSDQAATVLGSGRQAGSRCDESPRATIVPPEPRGAHVGPNSAQRCANRGESGGGAGPGAPGDEGSRGVAPRDCLETGRVSPSSPSSGRHSNPAGIAGSRDTAEQTAWADEEHGPPTVPDFRREDAFADRLPPPPRDAEGECE
jgi:hypothetical protein